MSSADSPKKKVKKIVIISGVVVLLCAAVWMCLRQRQKKPVNTVPGNVISTAKVERRDLSNSVSVTGSIESVDFRTVTSEVKDVKVSEVLAGVGEYVEEGQVIARFDTSELEEKLAKCRSNYTVNQTLDSIKNSPLDTYNEALEKAAKNYSETETAYHTKAAEYQTANNACEEAYQEALRQFGIAGGAEDARGQLEAAIASMTQEDAAYQQKNAAAKAWESAKQNLSGIESSFVSAETAMIRGKEAYDEEVKKAKQTYDEAVLSKQLISSDSDLEKIEEYEKQIEKCEIKAPVSGVIASIGVKENDTFSGGTVFTMLDNEHFKVTASVDEYDINNIKPGQKAYVRTNATGEAELPATVTYVAVTATAGAQNTSYQVEITLDEPQALLRAGMTASVNIERESAKNVLAVPYDCVTTDADGKSTVTLVEGETQRVVEVKKGLETEYYVEISGDGIIEGAKVLLPVALVNNTGNFGMEPVGSTSVYYFDGAYGGDVEISAPGSSAPRDGGFGGRQ